MTTNNNERDSRRSMTDAEIVAAYEAYMVRRAERLGMTAAEARELREEKAEERTRDYADLSSYRA